MALSINYTSEHGAVASTAYARIIQYRGMAGKMVVRVSISADATARANGLEQLGTFKFECDEPNTDMVPALYAILKTLDGFTNSIDV